MSPHDRTLMWDSFARIYDWQLWLEQPAVRIALDLAAIAPGERVLDVGTGTGAVLREVARRGLRPGSVLGVDRSPEMLARVRALPADWRLLRADATRLPLADSSIDVMIAGFLLHLLSDRERVACLRELGRVLAPDGRFVIVVPAYPAHPLGRASYQLLLHALNIVPGGIARTLQPIELEPDLQTTGFTITTTRRSHRGYPASCLLTRLIHPRPAS